MVSIIGIEPRADIRVPPDVAERGTLKGWKAAIEAATAVENCRHWILGAVAGFVGPVLSRCGFDTCGVNWSGPTTRGKTTAVALGVSAWSSPELTSGGLLRSMRATENSIELSARQSHCMTLGLDELAHADGKTVGRTIYFLSGGISKGRMSAQLTQRPQYSWRTFVMLSSEQTLAQKVVGDGGTWQGGMAARFPDVDCSDVEANVPQDTLAKIRGIYDNYGVAGGLFVGAFKKAGLHKQPKTAELRAKILDAANKIAGEQADGARRRAALPFALIGVCGTLAKEFGLLANVTDVEGAVKWGWARFSRSIDALVLDPEKHALSNLKRWINERWDSSIRNTDPSHRSFRDASGWYDSEAIYVPVARISEAPTKRR